MECSCQFDILQLEQTLTISSSSSQTEFVEESCPLLLGELAPGTIAGSDTRGNCKEEMNPREARQNMSEIVF